MIFTNQDKNLQESDVTMVEKQLEIRFPKPLKKLFIENNGGVPDRYIYEDHEISTAVNETLPLDSNDDRETAVDSYRTLVLEKKLVEPNFFPFANDAGGDYFFVDCNSDNADMYFFRSDSYPDSSIGLVNLHIGLDAFWLSLKTEEEE